MPITPVFMPPFSSIERIIIAVVVLPFVPVMPIVLSVSAGFPKNSALMKASAFLVSSVFITAAPLMSVSLLTIIAAAPASAAACAYLWPSAAEPTRHTNRQPLLTFLESYMTSLMSMSVSPHTTE